MRYLKLYVAGPAGRGDETVKRAKASVARVLVNILRGGTRGTNGKSVVKKKEGRNVGRGKEKGGRTYDGTCTVI